MKMNEIIKTVRKEIERKKKVAELLNDSDRKDYAEMEEKGLETFIRLYETGALSETAGDVVPDWLLNFAEGFCTSRNHAGLTVVRCLDLKYIYATKKWVRELMMHYYSFIMPISKEPAKSTENSAEETTEEATEEPATEEQEATPTEKTAKSTENSVEEETEEVTEVPEAEELEEVPAEETAKSTENGAFGYKINILEALKEIGYTSTRIRKEKLFAQVTLQKFRTGDTNISLQTVADICNLTGLQPWDILNFSAREAEELEEVPAEETAKSTENSVEEETEEVAEVPEAEELEEVPAEETAKSTENSAKKQKRKLMNNKAKIRIYPEKEWDETYIIFKKWEKNGKKRIYMEDRKNRTIGTIEEGEIKIVDCQGIPKSDIIDTIARFYDEIDLDSYTIDGKEKNGIFKFIAGSWEMI